MVIESLQESTIQFLKDNKDLIKQKDFKTLYKNALIGDALFGYVFELTNVFYSVGVDPLIDGIGKGKLTGVPSNYIAFSDVVPKPLPEGITSIERGAFACTGSFEDMILPQSLQVIGPSAFSHCDLRRITIPRNVSIIDDRAFKGCLMLNTVIIEGNPIIGSEAFAQCPNLKEIALKDHDYKKFYIDGVKTRYI